MSGPADGSLKKCWDLIRSKIKTEEPVNVSKAKYLGCEHRIFESASGNGGSKIRFLEYNMRPSLMNVSKVTSWRQALLLRVLRRSIHRSSMRITWSARTRPILTPSNAYIAEPSFGSSGSPVSPSYGLDKPPTSLGPAGQRKRLMAPTALPRQRKRRVT